MFFLSVAREAGKPNLYCVDKIHRVFGLRFDGMDDMEEHIRWNLERAKACVPMLRIRPGK